MSSITCVHHSLLLILTNFYLAIHSVELDTKFAVFHFFVCTVTDFSAGDLSIGVKFYVAVQSHLRQVFSDFGVIAPEMAELWASTGAIWRDMLLAEALVFLVCVSDHLCVRPYENDASPELLWFNQL